MSLVLLVSDSEKIRPLRVCGGTCGGTLKAKAYGYALWQVCSVALCHKIRITRCFKFYHNPPYWRLGAL
jgi:hypothetical protein